MIKKFCFIFLISLAVFSCVPHKKIVLLQHEKGKYDDTLTRIEYTYKLQSGDAISVNVTSLNEQVTEFFNLKSGNGPSGAAAGGFIINKAGYIHIPMLDSTYIKGLTIVQVQDIISKKIQAQVKDAYVVVRLSNFKFVTIGEFGKPGVMDVPFDKINILEALALAGNLSDLADRKNIRLIRENGLTSEIITLDLTDRDIIKSKYFYIQPNDILYAEPLRLKTFRSNITQLSMYVSLISIIVLFRTYIFK